MRFLTRSLAGVLILSLTIGLLALAASNISTALLARKGDDRPGRAAQERIFAVNVDRLQPATAHPTITAFGEVESARSLQIRAELPGRIVDLSEGFRNGGQVAAGELLVRIDPADAQSALALARAELAEAEAELKDANADLALARDDLAAAQRQRSLREQALARQQDLLGRGAGTSAAVETAELALAGAEQALVGRRQALAQAEARINRAGIALTRRNISVSEAERNLAETEIRAPFDGLLGDVSALRGSLVGTNEILGTLIDNAELEVSFRVSNAEFARLIRSDAGLTGTGITAALSLQDFPIEVAGTIVRAGAEVGDGQTGRLLYAQLDPAGAAALRPGDFLTITISEPPLPDVFTIPATAANSAGDILLIGPEDRLEAARVTILRRQGDMLIVGDAPPGRDIVTERLPQLGAGVKVRPVRPDTGFQAAEMIALDAERRARLIAAVEANTRMPGDARARVLARLAEDQVPKDMVDRIEARLGDAPQTAEMLRLDPERKARLIAFVEGNDRMPGDVKERLLTQLNAAEVPSDIVDRLERRMGG